MSKVTQQDIADRMGVSRNCISKALKGASGVSEATRRRVFITAGELGYEFSEPNAGCSRTVSLIAAAGTLLNQYWAHFIQGLETSLTRHAVRLDIHLIGDVFGAARHLRESQSQGALILWNRSDELLAAVLDTGIPTVCYDMSVDVPTHRLPCDVLAPASFEPVRELTRRLIANGHRRIGFVGDPDSCLTFRERWEGFQAAAAEAGLATDDRLCLRGQQDSLYQSPIYERALSQADIPTAFVCGNDYTAFLLLRALKSKGLRVPEDVSITGYDNLSECLLVEPELTTIDGFVVELGVRAGEMLLSRIDHPDRPCVLVHQCASCVYRRSDGAVTG